MRYSLTFSRTVSGALRVVVTSVPTVRPPVVDSVPPVAASVTLAVEHYNRMVRILEKGLPVKVTPWSRMFSHS